MPTKTTAKKKRQLSKQHLAALAEGRTMSATVDHYMQLIHTPKRRGRKVTLPVLTSRLATAQETFKSATGVGKLQAAQEIRDLKAKIAAAQASTNGHGLATAERAFVKVAKQFSANRQITYGAWRDAGVPAVVLRKAGIARTRG